MDSIKLSQDLETAYHAWLVDLRRTFHQHPELGFNEHKTAEKIAEILESLKVPFIRSIAKTGIVARLEGGRPGPLVAFRADMDALPLEEANDTPYRSKNPGVMHACGHDGHMTIGLGIIRHLVETGWTETGSGSILFIFQPAEEGGGGARVMLETGVLDSEPIQAIFAGHLYPQRPAGSIGVAHGVSNAASDVFTICLRGSGGHGAQPHLSKDLIVAGAQLVGQLQGLVSREISPMDSAVITVGKFQAGTAPNIIPAEATLVGTIRTLDPDVRRYLSKRMEALVAGLGQVHQIETQFDLAAGYPVLTNNMGLAGYVADHATTLLGADSVFQEKPRMGAEDFAYFTERWPGIIIGLGCHDPKVGFRHGLHTPHFNFDERALDVGVCLFVRLLTGYIEKLSNRSFE